MPKCRGCGEEIKFIRNARGRWLPIDPEMVRSKESKAAKLVTEDGVVKDTAGDEIFYGFVPHWDTCPNAEEFRKKG